MCNLAVHGMLKGDAASVLEDAVLLGETSKRKARLANRMIAPCIFYWRGTVAAWRNLWRNLWRGLRRGLRRGLCEAFCRCCCPPFCRPAHWRHGRAAREGRRRKKKRKKNKKRRSKRRGGEWG